MKYCMIEVAFGIKKEANKAVDELLNKLLEDDIANKISISFAPIEDWGGNDAGKASFSHEDFSKLHMQWIKFCIRHNIKPLIFFIILY